jgi:hypothetical protein
VLDWPEFADFAAVEPMLRDFGFFMSHVHSELPRVHDTSPHMLRHKDHLVTADVVEDLPDDPAGFTIYSLFFGIEKDEEYFRLLSDLRKLNDCMTKPGRMGIPCILQLIAEILANRWLAHVDARSYFFQFRLAECIRNFFAAIFRWGRSSAKVRATVLLMGWKFAPMIAQRFANGVCTRATLEGLIRAWLDNFMCLAMTEAACNEQLGKLLSVAKEVNLEFKDAEGACATQHATLLGMDVDLCVGKVTMSASFVQKALQAIEALRASPTARNLFVALGSMIWANYVVGRSPLAVYPNLLALTRGTGVEIGQGTRKWDDAMQINDATWADIRRAEQVVQANEGIFRVDIEALPDRRMTIWSDASDTAFAFVIEVDGVDVSYGAGLFGVNQRSLHIYVKEMLSAVFASEAAVDLTRRMPMLMPSAFAVDHMEDNTAVVGTFKRGHGNDAMIDELVIRMYAAYRQMNATGHMHYVPTTLQRADGMTRNGSTPGPRVDVTPFLTPQIPKRLKGE